MNKNNKIKTQDYVKNRYVIRDVDYIWTLDFTNIINSKKYNVWVFTIMDLSTRKILLHYVKEGSFTTEEVIRLLEEAFIHYGNRPNFIHTDLGGQFVSIKYKEFLDLHEIKYSYADRRIAKHSNQVHERFHRTLKGIIKVKAKELLQFDSVPKSLKVLQKIKMFKDLSKLLNDAINVYNEKEHQHLSGASPNQTEQALLLYDKENKAIISADNVKIIAKNNTKHGDQIIEYKNCVIQDYAGNWEQFFVEWRDENKKDTQKIINEIKIQNEKTLNTLLNENQSLKETVQLMHEQITSINDRELQKASLEKDAIERRIARRNRNRRPLRDAATAPELAAAFSCVDESEKISTYCKERDRVSLLMLYLFGIRVSNLLLIRATHLQQLLNDSSITFPLTKSKRISEISYPISDLFRKLIDESKNSFLFLLKNKKDDDFVITPEYSTKSLNRVTLTNRVNNILECAGKKCHKKLSSHSFRIGFTTVIIEDAGIDVAQNLIGHANIATTAVYSRRVYDDKMVRKTLDNVERKRQLRLKKTYNIKPKKTK